MSDSFIFPDTPGGLPPDDQDPAGDAPPSADFGDLSFDGAPSFGDVPFEEAPGAGATFAGATFGADDFGGAGDDFGAPLAAPAFGDFPTESLADEGVHLGGDPFAIPEVDASDFDFDVPALADDGGVDVSFAQAAPVAAPEADDDAPKPKKAKAPRRSKEGLVLGLHVTSKQVFGVLVRPSADGYEPLRQFVRQRTEGGGPGATALSPDEIGEESLEMAAADDASVQFGGAGEIDFSAEFAGLGVAADGGFETMGASPAVSAVAQPIIFELRDILEECAQAGFARPALAFAVDAPDVAYAELTVPPEKKKAKAKKPKKGADDAPAEPTSAPPKRERLLELMPEIGTAYDKERVAFVPMTPRDGQRRFMAVVPTGSEPVAESLEMLREQSAHRKTVVKTLEAEVPLLVGLVRLTSNPEPHENTALVRVGTEDTIVLLLTGGQIHHYEPMQSVTAFDGPDTICSRVLLQQDVQGVGMVHNVVIVAEEREKELVQGFAAFYPEARVETLREGMARIGLVGPYGPLAPVLMEAAGAAVAGHRAKTKHNPFDDANLLPASLMKRKRVLDFSFSWHTLVVAVLLFLSVLFFSYLYVSQKGEIATAEQRLAEFPPEAQMSVPQLQARIDSLRGRQESLTAALGALDSLLIDTDRWTQTLLRTTRSASQTGGIWIEEWAPSGSDISLTGYATTRDKVVSMAQRLEGTIEEVTFQAVRDYPVYAYRIRFTQPPELPQVTRVLRERTAEPEALAPAPLDGMDAAP